MTHHGPYRPEGPTASSRGRKPPDLGLHMAAFSPNGATATPRRMSSAAPLGLKRTKTGAYPGPDGPGQSLPPPSGLTRHRVAQVWQPAFIAAFLCLLPHSDVLGQTTLPADLASRAALLRRAVEARPVRGPAFEQLCALYDAGPGVEALAAEYEAALRREPTRTALRLLLGHLAAARDRWSDAREHYQAAADREPTNFTALLSLGQACAETNDLDAAVQALAAAVGHAPNADQQAAAGERLGDVLARAGRWEEARTAFQTAARTGPQPAADPLLRLARAAERAGQLRQAIDVYRQVLTHTPLDPRVALDSFREIGRLAERLGDAPQAIEAYQSALDLTEPGSWLRAELRRQMLDAARAGGRLDALASAHESQLAKAAAPSERLELLVASADALADLSRLDDSAAERASQRFREALALAPTDAALRRRCVGFLTVQGRYAEAAEALRPLAETGTVADAFQLAEALLAAQRRADAEAVWADIAQRFAADKPVLRQLAEVYRRHARPEQALAIYRDLVARDAGDFESVRGLAVALAADQRYDEALAAWQALTSAATTDAVREQADDQALGLLTLQGALGQVCAEYERRLSQRPDDLDAGLFLAKVYLRLNDVGTAIHTYQRLLKQDARNVRVRTALAAAYERGGLYAEARQEYSTLAAAAANDPAARRRHLAAVVAQSLRLNDRAGAVDAAQSILADHPRDPKAHAELAEVYVHFQDYDRALAAYDEALRLAPREFGYADAKARLLDLLGRTDQAMALYERVLRTAADPAALTQTVRELIRYAPARADLERLAATLRARCDRQPREWTNYALLLHVARALRDDALERHTLDDARRQAADRTAPLRALVEYAERRGRADEALVHAEELFARTPNPPAAQTLHLIDLLLRLDRTARANRLAERLAAQITGVRGQGPGANDDEPDGRSAAEGVLQSLFSLYVAAGRAEEAVRWLEAIVAHTPADLDARLRLGQLKADLGDLAGAEAAYRAVLFPLPPSPAPSSLPGPASWVPGPPAPSAAKRPGVGTGRHDALLGLIRLARAQDTLPALADEFRRRLDAAPRDEQAHRDYVAVLSAQGDADPILSAHCRAAETWPESAAWQTDLAAAAERLGRWTVAAAAHERLAALDRAAAADHLLHAARALLVDRRDTALDRLIAMHLSGPKADAKSVLAVASALLSAGDAVRTRSLLLPLAGPESGAARQFGLALGDLLSAAGDRAAASAAYLARFDKPLGPGLSEVWPSLEARRSALRAAWRLMTSDERRTLAERVKAEAAADPAARDRAERWAAVAELAGRDDDRLAALDRLVALAPDDRNLPYQVLDVQRQLGRPQAAHALALRLLKAAQQPSARRDIGRRLINTYAAHDPGDQLADLIERTFLADRPVEADYRTAAAALARWGRPTRAAALLERALDLAPDDLVLARQLADLYQKTGQTAARRDLYRRLVQRTTLPALPAPGAASADLYAAREALLLPVIEVYRNAGRLEELRARAQTRRDAAPAEPAAAYDLAILERHAGRADAALDVLADLVRRRPGDVAAKEALAQAYVRAGQSGRAAPLYEQLLRLAPTMGHSLYRALADCYAHLGREADRLAALEDLAARYRDAEVYEELARLYRQAGRRDEAARAYEQYLSAAGAPAPGAEADRCRQLARFRASMGDLDGARQALEDGQRRVRLLVDGRRQAQELQVEWLAIAAQHGRLADTVRELEAQAAQRPNDDDALALLAEALHRQGNFERETAVRRRLADRAPTDVGRQAALARALADATHVAEAAAIYEALAQRDPNQAATHLANAANARFRAATQAAQPTPQSAIDLWWKSADEAHRRNAGTAHHQSADAYYRLGATFEQRGLPDEAERAYARALSAATAPTYDLLSAAARLLVRRAKSDAALTLAADWLPRTAPGAERTTLIQALLPYGRENAALLRTLAAGLAKLPALATDDELAVEVQQTIGERFTAVGDPSRAAAAYAAAIARQGAHPDPALVRALDDAKAAADIPR
jgi:tetratricopeptide (TPR) repeat protein